MRTLTLFALSLAGMAALTDDASALGRRKKNKSSCQPACASPCGGYAAHAYAPSGCGGYASVGYAAPAFAAPACGGCSAGIAADVGGFGAYAGDATFAAPTAGYVSGYSPTYAPVYQGGGYYAPNVGFGSGVGFGGGNWMGGQGAGIGPRFGVGNVWGGIPGRGGLWR